MSDIDEIVLEFVVESFEGLDKLDAEFLALESNPQDVETLQSIFRIIHSIKGACGFLEFQRLEAVAHAGENVLDALREGRLRLNDDLTTTLLEMNDAVRALLAVIESTGSDAAGNDYAALIERLEAVLQCPEEDGGSSAVSPQVDLAGNEAPAQLEAPLGTVSSASESSIRLRVSQLDALMNLAGELVLARNQMLQHAARVDDSATQATAQRLSRITTELQEGIMKIRMQPVGNLWSKLPRVVRDLSLQLSKEVELEMVGAETEVDKSLLEAIKDPLTHLVRNALDHGIESEEERASLGKSKTAVLRLSAFHDSGQVNIVVADDGRGIDPDAVRARAVESGLLTEAQAERTDDRAAMELLFAPGFSTAREVTNLSGRGVGMDVVRRNLERVGGTVEIDSTVGEGTEITIRIPLTLAIIPALTVDSAGNRYAIPQANLVELLHVGSNSAEERIESVFGQRVFRLRGELLPLVDLNEQLGVPRTAPEDECIIVVVQAASRTFGLVVDGIHESEEIVVKPLDRVVKDLGAYAGTTILADGRVALILDVSGLAARAELMSADELSVASRKASLFTETAAAVEEEGREFLVFKVGGDRRLAMDLAAVDRLEDIDPEQVEWAGATRFLQYRDHLVQLLDVGEAVGAAPCASRERCTWKTVVRRHGDLAYGLVVDEVEDILTVPASAQTRASHEDAIESVMVIDGQVTEVIDEAWLLEALRAQAAAASAVDQAPSIESLEDRDATGAASSQLCTFRLAGTLYGIDVLDVQEVLRPQQRTPIPLSPPAVEGLLNLRGDTVLAVDLGTLLATDPGSDLSVDASASRMNVVVRTKQGGMSVLVDEIGEVIELPAALFEPCPTSVPGSLRRAVRGVFKLPEELLLQLDADSLAELVASSREEEGAVAAEAALA